MLVLSLLYIAAYMLASCITHGALFYSVSQKKSHL